MSERVDLFGWLLGPRSFDATLDLEACYETLEALDARFESSIDRAAAGGFVADRLGYAFVAGYRAALACLAPGVSRASLCATEDGGAHPRAIRTRIEPQGDAFVLTGQKTYATLASRARTLLVVASAGERSGRNSLRVATLPASRAGVKVEDRPPVAFAPEIPHARVSFEAVRVEPAELAPGDGYETVLKPFRTLEDVHVMASLLGHVVRLTRQFAESTDTLELALATLAALRDCGARDPLAPSTHVTLAGILGEATRAAGGCTLARADEATRARWQRDLPLLQVAAGARAARRQAAYERLGLGARPADSSKGPHGS
ncbi:MAG TPA: acyl-CoA dehydrogenase family protein [Polyangiaceae bacterium]|nr:acyl-CoA dehydrogenase family protein [Polyangiaceae bacterium]